MENKPEFALYPAEAGAETAPLFLLLGDGERAGAAAERVRALTQRPFSLAGLPVEDWNMALSPWPAKAVFKGSEDFGGGGDATLRDLGIRILPRVREALGAPTAPVYLAGYSLAGLLAVYGLYRLPGLAGAVCCSGSLWFPGFLEYAADHDPAGQPERVYLSLGDREKRSRNPVLSRVEENTLRFRDLLTVRGIPCAYFPEPGNHFQDPEGRLARGIAWCLRGE